ncbi:SH3 domain-containing protein [Crenobacter caeni]|uniref:SH3 domain-containing protein n=1 Tax=Crenobacter caeni TaxID=2705474 RepID=A0A6B2KVU4_9NEIS|nr:SH3 domain-containing protein [Crenobacter caeni]NDV14291.1 SH3 domain-containing protein [Crenobacter caeni]
MKLRLVTALLAAALAGHASALEFRSVKETGVSLYDAPSLTAKRLFVVSRYYPVEVLSQQKEWARVRDASGGVAWIPAAALSVQRMLLVTAPEAAVHRAASAGAPLAYRLPKNAVVELTGQVEGGWAPVRHRDGAAGFVRIGEVWGL